MCLAGAAATHVSQPGYPRPMWQLRQDRSPTSSTRGRWTMLLQCLLASCAHSTNDNTNGFGVRPSHRPTLPGSSDSSSALLVNTAGDELSFFHWDRRPPKYSPNADYANDANGIPRRRTTTRQHLTTHHSTTYTDCTCWRSQPWVPTQDNSACAYNCRGHANLQRVRTRHCAADTTLFTDWHSHGLASDTKGRNRVPPTSALLSPTRIAMQLLPLHSDW